MNHVYLFDEIGRASSYGVGTYIRNVVSLCMDCSIPVTVVTLSAVDDMNWFEHTKNVRYINIPFLKDSKGRLYDLDNKDKRREFCLYVVSVMQLFVSNTDKNIFHLNYTQDYFLAKSLKKQWPLGKILVTIHYFTWCFALSGNVCQLSWIVSKGKDALSEYEQKVIYSGLFEQQLFQIVDSIVCLSDFARQVLIGYYEIPKEKIWLIPNGQKDLYEKRSKILLRQKYKIPLDKKMLLFVGRLDRIKGVDYLIKAFKVIANEELNAHLYLIGDGNFKKYQPLCSSYEDRITFCGKIYSEKLADFYQMSDLGIIPSLHEQCSYVAIEMMMYGVPVIGTNSTGLDEMIEDGVNGFKISLQETEEKIIFPVDDLVSKLRDCLKMPSLEKLSCQSRTLYLRRYTLRQMQDKLNRLYNVLLQE